MTVQSNYNVRPDAYFEGQLVDGGHATITSHIVEDATLEFGKPVSQGTDDAQIVIGSDANNAFIGLTLRLNSGGPAPANGWASGDTASVLRGNGAIAVVVAEAVEAGDAAYFTNDGTIAKTATNNTPMTGARFETSAAQDGIAVLRLA